MILFKGSTGFYQVLRGSTGFGSQGSVLWVPFYRVPFYTVRLRTVAPRLFVSDSVDPLEARDFAASELDQTEPVNGTR